MTANSYSSDITALSITVDVKQARSRQITQDAGIVPGSWPAWLSSWTMRIVVSINRVPIVHCGRKPEWLECPQHHGERKLVY